MASVIPLIFKKCNCNCGRLNLRKLQLLIISQFLSVPIFPLFFGVLITLGLTQVSTVDFERLLPGMGSFFRAQWPTDIAYCT